MYNLYVLLFFHFLDYNSIGVLKIKLKLISPLLCCNENSTKYSEETMPITYLINSCYADLFRQIHTLDEPLNGTMRDFR
jgi:hypothetical protein